MGGFPQKRPWSLLGRSQDEHLPGGRKGAPGQRGCVVGVTVTSELSRNGSTRTPPGPTREHARRWPQSRSSAATAEPSPGPGQCGREEVSASTRSLPDRWPPAHGECQPHPALALELQQPLQGRAPEGSLRRHGLVCPPWPVEVVPVRPDGCQLPVSQRAFRHYGKQVLSC